MCILLEGNYAIVIVIVKLKKRSMPANSVSRDVTC